MTRCGEHALVIGASMGGLLAARVLAEHYDRVTIIERDGLPEKPEPRKGVPQGRHTHALHARGREGQRAERAGWPRDDSPLAGERRPPPAAALAQYLFAAA
jgi:2-polyprenyl-6-methoxyphenol hydroxylase-like FAD-dependent oxidoreductase